MKWLARLVVLGAAVSCVIPVASEWAMACSCSAPLAPPAVEFEGIASGGELYEGSDLGPARRWEFEVIKAIRGTEEDERIAISMLASLVDVGGGNHSLNTCGVDADLIAGERYHVGVDPPAYEVMLCTGFVDGPRGEAPIPVDDGADAGAAVVVAGLGLAVAAVWFGSRGPEVGGTRAPD